uniref:Uncharacterized protein n=1 Tax=Parascaris equorum TaxID=6256 RepID=A0A914R7H1_PAREQ
MLEAFHDVNEKVGFLKMELVVLMKLRDSGRTRHFCTIEDKGRFRDFFYIVMTMVGRSLQVGDSWTLIKSIE